MVGNPQLTWIHRNGQIGVAKSTLLLMEMSVALKTVTKTSMTNDLKTFWPSLKELSQRCWVFHMV